MNTLFSAKFFGLFVLLLSLSGCVSYSVTEQEMTDYLNQNLKLDRAVGIEDVLYAKISVDDLKVNIGRADKDRVAVYANTTAELQMMSQPDMSLDLDIEFSAIPEYKKETGEVFLKSLRLERLDEDGSILTPEIRQLIKPAVSLIGNAVSSYPVYQLDESTVKQSLLKSSNPKVTVENNKLVIDFFD
ncbi:DUF1439 domain-containing protein [Vibrio maritimus]|uniref:DUF1439 domain-containing protein n=1 Tax=Vibrio maritimus TaxID=990268 RepID=UPI001F34E4DE|nr:DUF1439 domain-containing protein [Vibrio maritimus]